MSRQPKPSRPSRTPRANRSRQPLSPRPSSHRRISRRGDVMRSRRWFLRTSGLAVGILGTSQVWLKPALAQARPARKVLVAILQRGAADGLNIVVPFSEKRYYQLRPGIGVPMPSTQPGIGSIDLDGKFSLHNALQQLRPLL